MAAFALVTRQTKLGYEWQLFEVPLPMRLALKQARYEHVTLRKLGGYALQIIAVTEDHLNRLHLLPAVSYLSYLGSMKSKKRIAQVQTEPIDA